MEEGAGFATAAADNEDGVDTAAAADILWPL